MKGEIRSIGRREWIGLPDLGVSHIEAKVDTGAFRTAVHCESIRLAEHNGVPVLEAVFNLDGKGPRVYRFETFRLRTIKNSFGQTESRYCVRTTLRIAGKKIKSDVSLSDRSGMKYQVLIGRKTIGRKFLVDVSRVFLGGKR